MQSLAQLKKAFLYSLIGSLIVSALVAVVAVLVGEFSEFTQRVIFTLVMVMLHSLVSLLFIWDDERKDTFDRLPIFSNAFFVVTIFSFMTSLASIWEFVGSDIVGRLYMTYVITIMAALHIDALAKMMHKDHNLDLAIRGNYLFVAIVYVLIQVVIYAGSGRNELPEFFYRVLAAAGIIDGTLGVLCAILFKLYVHNHPESTSDPNIMALTGTTMATPGSEPVKRKPSVWIYVLGLYLVLQTILGMTRIIVGSKYGF